jgi:cytochrome P450
MDLRKDSDHISEAEIVQNMFLLIVAGSETTATLLTGVTYFLLRNPTAYKKITEEIRSTFSSEDQITIQDINTKLPYTIACLTEGLRVYPPAPSSFPRTTYQDEIISGHAIPKDTQVGVHQSAAYFSESNFHRAGEFIPERWLPESTKNKESEFYNDSTFPY